jgi:hypothetical protein
MERRRMRVRSWTNSETQATLFSVGFGGSSSVRGFKFTLKMKSLFYELLDMYLDKKKAHQK